MDIWPPRSPLAPEARILHSIDLMDVRAEILSHCIETMTQYEHQQTLLRRYLYLS